VSSAGAAAAAAPVEAAKHDAADAGLENSLCVLQSLLQAGAFLELGFVDGRFAQQEPSDPATPFSGGVDFECEPGGSSDGQSG
jgi:hypothetical protein